MSLLLRRPMFHDLTVDPDARALRGRPGQDSFTTPQETQP